MKTLTITRRQIVDYINKNGIVTQPQVGNIAEVKECKVLGHRLGKCLKTIVYEDAKGKLFKLPQGNSFTIELDTFNDVDWFEANKKHGSESWDYKMIANDAPEIAVLAEILAEIA